MTLLAVLFSFFTTKLREIQFFSLYAICLNIHMSTVAEFYGNFFWYLYIFQKIIADVKMDEGAVLVGTYLYAF